MKDFKEYEEYEVWVAMHYAQKRSTAGYLRAYLSEDRVPQEHKDEFVKTVIRIPKPERKVTITEGELRAILSKQETVDVSRISGNQVSLSFNDLQENIIEDVFGRRNEEG